MRGHHDAVGGRARQGGPVVTEVDVEVVLTRNAGWRFRCNRCDVTDLELTRDEARRRAWEHLAAHGGTTAEEDRDAG